MYSKVNSKIIKGEEKGGEGERYHACIGGRSENKLGRTSIDGDLEHIRQRWRYEMVRKNEMTKGKKKEKERNELLLIHTHKHKNHTNHTQNLRMTIDKTATKTFPNKLFSFFE